MLLKNTVVFYYKSACLCIVFRARVQRSVDPSEDVFAENPVHVISLAVNVAVVCDEYLF